VAATARDLAGLSHLRGAAGELLAAGVDVLLPAAAHPDTAVLRAFRGDGGSWQRVPVPRGTRLSGWLTGGD
jgi:hypothetical protein